MKKVMKYWIRFWHPGSFVAEQSEREVATLPKPEEVAFPDSAYAFTLHEREDAIDGDTVYTGSPRQIGPTYYHPDSKVETLDQVKANPSASRILVSNMECNGWGSVIWSRWGNWPQPFKADEQTIVGQA